VAFVQPYIPQDVKWHPAKAAGISTLESTALAARGTLPDLMLWPEAVYTAGAARR
jgi:apolipoprotein N-acyltransferase